MQDCELYFSERGSVRVLRVCISGLGQAHATVSVEGSGMRAWDGRSLSEAVQQQLRTLCMNIPAEGAPASTRPNGQSYELKLNLNGVQAQHTWWGELSGTWAVLNQLVALCHLISRT